MKHIYSKAALILILMAGVLTACKKSFLEIVPKGELVAQTTSDYDGLLNSSNLLTFSANAQIQMGDEVAAVDPYFTAAVLKTQAGFRWEAVLYQPSDDAGETVLPLKNIYLYNKIINEVPHATDGTDQQKLSIAAEAMAGRAWTYFLLINYYGKPYNAKTAATDPGFPIIKNADVTTTNFSRATVQQVYDFIIQDLTTAIPNLPSQISYRTRMSKAAAEGLLGKVYTFMGRYNDALTQLNTSIADLANQPIPVRLYDYNVEFDDGGVFTPDDVDFGPSYPLLPNNYENVYGRSTSDSWTFIYNELVLNPQAAALFGPTDLRLKFYTNTTAFTQTPYPVAGVLRHWGYSQAQFGVVLPDLYLLKAECECRGNDLTDAVSDVQTLRAKRMPAADAVVPAATASQQLPLLKFILNERIREFAVQGYRWFDMRRLSVDPLFQGVTYTHTLYSATGSATTFQLSPDRFTLQIPPKLMNQNPNMVNNP
ncbi:RagB/SusD family nutrient uptake outer membrane protein [Pedobacter sp. L105]|uniref:RagB/SusD family nutrient uptake outer membrane protein n=1 Tax=Pedobacter sp. L105 TaxID=1641871 RepID=UPI001C20588F|nr:RagB/SusD family nutrient uptake outer membrane protein [Pedobacter sp. L105]